MAPGPQLRVPGHVLRDGGLGDAAHREVVAEVGQVVGVRVAVLAAAGLRLHVDVVPGDGVLHPRGQAPGDITNRITLASYQDAAGLTCRR